MGKKLTYEYVKTFIENKSNGKCELLSKDYKNSISLLKLKCKCGNIFYAKFNKLKKSQLICKECVNKQFSEKYRHDIQTIKDFIKEMGCEYVGGEYINVKSLLTIKCKCGNLFQKSFLHFKRGQIYCLECSKEKVKKAKIKYTKEVACEILQNKGLKLCGEYVDASHEIECVCEKGHKFKTKLYLVLYNNFGCLECSKQYYVGENANHYKGGESEVLDRLRKILKDWKINVAKKYNFSCCLTKTKKDCVVHHLIPFMQIVKSSCEELGLELHKKIKDYTPNELKKLEQLVLQKHTLDIGVLLQRKVHTKFHTIYGKVGNTKEQFEEFAKKYYPKKFCE